MIPLSVGASRVVQGVRVEHVCGDPRLSPDLDRELGTRIVEAGLKAPQSTITEPTRFDPAAVEERDEVLSAT